MFLPFKSKCKHKEPRKSSPSEKRQIKGRLRLADRLATHKRCNFRRQIQIIRKGKISVFISILFSHITKEFHPQPISLWLHYNTINPFRSIYNQPHSFAFTDLNCWVIPWSLVSFFLTQILQDAFTNLGLHANLSCPWALSSSTNKQKTNKKSSSDSRNQTNTPFSKALLYCVLPHVFLEQLPLSTQFPLILHMADRV